MHVSVRANVRTAEAARKGLAQGLAIAFRAGPLTGMLVAGLALLSVAGYYPVLVGMGVPERAISVALVELGFGPSLTPLLARLGRVLLTTVPHVAAAPAVQLKAAIHREHR